VLLKSFSFLLAHSSRPTLISVSNPLAALMPLPVALLVLSLSFSQVEQQQSLLALQASRAPSPPLIPPSAPAVALAKRCDDLGRLLGEMEARTSAREESLRLSVMLAKEQGRRELQRLRQIHAQVKQPLYCPFVLWSLATAVLVCVWGGGLYDSKAVAHAHDDPATALAPLPPSLQEIFEKDEQLEHFRRELDDLLGAMEALQGKALQGLAPGMSQQRCDGGDGVDRAGPRRGVLGDDHGSDSDCEVGGSKGARGPELAGGRSSQGTKEAQRGSPQSPNNRRPL